MGRKKWLPFLLEQIAFILECGRLPDDETCIYRESSRETYDLLPTSPSNPMLVPPPKKVRTEITKRKINSDVRRCSIEKNEGDFMISSVCLEKENFQKPMVFL